MTPLFACLPVCMTLTVIGFLAVVILVLDYVNRVPGEEQPAPKATAEPAKGDSVGERSLYLASKAKLAFTEGDDASKSKVELEDRPRPDLGTITTRF